MLTSLNNTELVWVDQPKKLREIAEELQTQEILAVDTESNSLYAYREQVCLVQISSNEKDYLIDALVLPDLSPLAPIFSSKKILNVFHAAEYDLICMFRDYGFRFNFLFDTMIAARTLGFNEIGLGSLLEKYFGVKINKKYQRANWGKRPLKADMLEYARLDSHYLIPLQERLRVELEEAGRWELALEDFRRLTQNIEDTTESSEEDFWKLRGARDLSPQQAAVLKSVYQYRESLAKEQDKPSFKIFSNQLIVDIAQNCPRQKDELACLSSINESIAARYSKGLIQAVREGKSAPPAYPPHYDRPENGILDRIEELREWRKVTGQKMGVPSDVVLPRDVLNRIAWAGPQTAAGIKENMKDVPYRFERFGDDILRVLKNGASQR